MDNSKKITISWWDKQIPKLFYCGALHALTINTSPLQTEQGSHGQAVPVRTMSLFLLWGGKID